MSENQSRFERAMLPISAPVAGLIEVAYALTTVTFGAVGRVVNDYNLHRQVKRYDAEPEGLLELIETHQSERNDIGKGMEVVGVALGSFVIVKTYID